MGGGRDRGQGYGQEQEDGGDANEAIHALHETSASKQLAISPPGSGTVRDNPAVTRRTTTRRRKALLRDAERIIKKRYAESGLSLADVAEAVGSSPRQVQRAFREEAGTEFRAVLLGVRVEAARRLLGESATVTAAARAVGYRSASGLTAAFRRIGSEPPSAFQPEPPEFLGDADEAALASAIRVK